MCASVCVPVDWKTRGIAGLWSVLEVAHGSCTHVGLLNYVHCASIRYFMNAIATGCRADGSGYPPCGAGDGGALRHPLHRGAMSPFHPIHPF